MKKIYKFAILSQRMLLSFPGLEVVSVIEQDSRIMVYGTVEEGAEPVEYKIYVLNTGDGFEIADTAKFLGTVSLYNGNLIKHVFCERVPTDKMGGAQCRDQ